MKKNKPIKTYKKALNTFGIRNQLIKSIEEMAELTKEICKYLDKKSKSNINGIIEESADVQIMLNQIKLKFPNEIMMEKKLKRLNGLVNI